MKEFEMTRAGIGGGGGGGGGVRGVSWGGQSRLCLHYNQKRAKGKEKNIYLKRLLLKV